MYVWEGMKGSSNTNHIAVRGVGIEPQGTRHAAYVSCFVELCGRNVASLEMESTYVQDQQGSMLSMFGRKALAIWSKSCMEQKENYSWM